MARTNKATSQLLATHAQEALQALLQGSSEDALEEALHATLTTPPKALPLSRRLNDPNNPKEALSDSGLEALLEQMRLRSTDPSSLTTDARPTYANHVNPAKDMQAGSNVARESQNSSQPSSNSLQYFSDELESVPAGWVTDKVASRYAQVLPPTVSNVPIDRNMVEQVARAITATDRPIQKIQI